jgi:hypothetical protein
MVEIILRITGDARFTRTYKRKHAHLSILKYILLIYKSKYAQPGETYAQITKENSCTPTNIEQEPHMKNLISEPAIYIN